VFYGTERVLRAIAKFLVHLLGNGTEGVEGRGGERAEERRVRVGGEGRGMPQK